MSKRKDDSAGRGEQSRDEYKFTPAEMAEAIRRNNGNKSAAARTLNCSRTTVHKYIAEFEEVREAAEVALEIKLDTLEEEAMWIATNRSHPHQAKMIEFGLKTQGRKRGYGDKTEITQMNLTPDDAPDEDARASLVEEYFRIRG